MVAQVHVLGGEIGLNLAGCVGDEILMLIGRPALVVIEVVDEIGGRTGRLSGEDAMMDHPTVAVTAARVPAARVPAARVPAARVPTARFARVEGVEGVATALRREEIPVALVDETRRVRITY